MPEARVATQPPIVENSLRTARGQVRGQRTERSDRSATTEQADMSATHTESGSWPSVSLRAASFFSSSRPDCDR
jgi:hypothetical protein